jgi:hypothetical protein
MISGPRASGKTTLLNQIRRHVVACPDAWLAQASAGKDARGDEAWDDFSVLDGNGTPAGALDALASVRDIIYARVGLSIATRTGGILTPDYAHPLWVLVVDGLETLLHEVPDAAGLLQWITFHGRAEGVCLIGTTLRAISARSVMRDQVIITASPGDFRVIRDPEGQ